jgi:hypothetical protein
LALTSPTNGGPSFGLVCSQTKATVLSLWYAEAELVEALSYKPKVCDFDIR